ncbi:ATP-binding protein [uncultured Brevundimonas sp.]|uniref:ATP-binding protein n=1 Tax=uncultured Brevundimonas sp. TaxID=213418 RepID=UPI0030EDA2D5|tara:strand:+ start:2087 stop:3724 length:1638 start_codon:yes stop_codon:yes gene_type:complete
MPDAADLAQDNASLRERLREAEETLEAIRSGDVDAVVIGGGDGQPQIYTLETADQTYRILVEQMQEGALTLMADGTVLYCNRRLAGLLGVPATRVVGARLQNFVAEAEVAALEALIAAGSAKGEIAIKAAHGGALLVHFTFSELGDAAPGSPKGALCCVVTDLTEQRHTEGLLRQSQKMEAIGQLTGGVAHDFNNLLMVISGGLDMMARGPDPTRRERLLSGMRNAVQRGAGLTRQLLAFSRRHALEPEPIDIARQVGEMRELLDRSLSGAVQVRTAFAPDLWPVLADPTEFELVLLNLTVNARDAMADGGRITVGGDNRRLAGEDGLTGEFVQITVADTGEGMPESVIARACEPFFTTKDIGKGSGLGLAQAYGFARESGGTLKIESEVGVGTTISILLPRSLAAPAAATATSEHAFTAFGAMPGSVGVALLVEDDVEVGVLVGEMLAQLGYEVIRAASAVAALGALADGRTIDLVFSDVMMPGGMNGVELAREVRRRRPNLPVLLTSGFAESVRREVESEGIALLPKPYRIGDLAEALAALTD